MEDGGVEIMEVHHVRGHIDAILIALTVGGSTLDSRAGQPG